MLIFKRLPWTADFFYILHILCGQFTAAIEMSLFQQVIWAFLPLSHFFSKSVHHLLSQILAFGLLPSKLNQYQQNVSLQCKWHLDVFTHCLMQLGMTQNANLQLQMHKLCFDI